MTVFGRPPGHHGSHENGGSDEIDVAGLDGLLADAQTPAVHGAAEHTDVTRELFIPATTADTYGDTAYYYAHAKLLDAATNQAEGNGVVPSDFVSLISVKAYFFSESSGDVALVLGGAWCAAGENIWAATGATGVEIVTITAEILTTYDFTAVLAGLAAGDIFGFEIVRNGGAVADTLTDTLRVIGFVLEYTANQ